MMNLSLLCAGGALITAAAVTFMPQSTTLDGSIFEDLEQTRQIPEGTASVKLTLADNMTMRQLVHHIRDVTELGVFADWNELAEVGIGPDTQLCVDGSGLPLDFVLERLADRFDEHDGRFDWRLDRDTLILGSGRAFERREVTLAVYDVRGILDQGIESDQLTDLLMTFVSPDDWQDNGGELGTLSIVRGRLFIDAPPRMHRRSAWILEQLEAGVAPRPDSAGTSAAARPRADRSPGAR